MNFKNFKNLSVSRASIFIYVVMIMSIFMLMFSTIVLLISKNMNYTAQSSTKSKLMTESDSFINKVIGLYQLNPKNPSIVAQSQKRDVDLLAYVTKLSGYVYQGKSDVVRIDKQSYVWGKNPPTDILISNTPYSKSALKVIVRKINPVNSFILASVAKTINAGATLSSSGSDMNALFGTGEDFATVVNSYVVEVILFSDAQEGALYTMEADKDMLDTDPKKGWLVKNDFAVSVTSYENSKNLGVGQKANRTETSFLQYPSLHASAPSDFGEGYPASSVSVPGISPAYIDTFEADSSKDWNNLNEKVTRNESAGIITIPQGGQYTLNRNINGDFDMRVKIQGRLAGGNAFGIFSTGNNETYRLRVQNLYTNTQVVATDGTVSCVKSTTKQPTYFFHDHTTNIPNYTTGVTSEETGACNYLPRYNSYVVSGTNYFYLRMVRSGTMLNAYYCDGDNCDPAEGYSTGWVMINKDSLSVGAGDMRVGMFNDTVTAMVVDEFRVVQLLDASHPFEYDKTFSFGSEIPIKRVAIDGYIPSNIDFSVGVSHKENNQSMDDGRYSSLIFTPLNGGREILTNMLTLSIQMALREGETMTGDVSQIPFIHGISGSYEPVDLCMPKLCGSQSDNGTDDGCGGTIVCPTQCLDSQVICNGACVASKLNTSCDDYSACTTNDVYTDVCGTECSGTVIACCPSKKGQSCTQQCFTNTTYQDDCGNTCGGGVAVASVCPNATDVVCGTIITSTNGCGTCTGTGTKCDTGKTCTNGTCVALPECTGKADGTSCTDDGNVCTRDICSSGSCTHPAGNAGTVCRIASGVCDVAETCTGTSTACPTDTKVSVGQLPPSNNQACGLATCSQYIWGWYDSNPFTECRVKADAYKTCDGNGACKADYSDCTSMSSVAAGSGAAKCGSIGCKSTCPSGGLASNYNTVDKVCYTSGQHGCATGYTCNASGTCEQTACNVTYTPAGTSGSTKVWTNGNVNASPSVSGLSPYVFTNNGSYSWSGSSCSAMVDWIDKTAPTCGASWSPSSVSYVKGSQLFTLSESTDTQSGVDSVNTNTNCSVSVDGKTCSVFVKDMVGNNTNCNSPVAKIVPDSMLYWKSGGTVYYDDPSLLKINGIRGRIEIKTSAGVWPTGEVVLVNALSGQIRISKTNTNKLRFSLEHDAEYVYVDSTATLSDTTHTIVVTWQRGYSITLKLDTGNEVISLPAPSLSPSSGDDVTLNNRVTDLKIFNVVVP